MFTADQAKRNVKEYNSIPHEYSGPYFKYSFEAIVHQFERIIQKMSSMGKTNINAYDFKRCESGKSYPTINDLKKEDISKFINYFENNGFKVNYMPFDGDNKLFISWND